MYDVLILWAPDSSETRKVVESMRSAFNEGRFKTTAKKAAESSIVDLAVADLVIFGLQKSGTSEVPPEYSELLRIFKGVTLAGRAAGVFSVGSEKASARMRKSLKDTEVSLFDDDPLFSDEGQGTASGVGEWANRLAGFFQEVRSTRE